jgi:ABC-type transport system involved in multi-copper enzyme maturation permease subunit
MATSARVPLTGRRSVIAWQPYLAVVIGLGAIGWEVWYGRRLTSPAQVLFFLALVVLEAVLIGHRWRRLCGPVLFYDVVRTARQGRYALARVAYAIVLFCLLNLLAQGWISGGPSGNNLAELAGAFFAQLLMVQFVVIIMLTPAYTAGSITEEKERQTLEYLLATDLSSREIVLGKFLSRLGSLGLLLLTGFPVIALLQLLGGIDPNLLLMAFAVTLLLMMSLASLSVLCSVYVRRTRNAIITAYAGLAIYLIGLPCLADWLFPSAWHKSTNMQPVAAIRDTLDLINYGNPFYTFGRIIEAAGGQVSILDELRGSLGRFAGIHIGITVIALTWAALRLRPLALRTRTGSRPVQDRGRQTRVVRGDPMVWKEMQPGSWSRRARILIVLLALLTLVPAVMCLWQGASRGSASLSENANGYVQIVGTMVACGLLLSIMLRSSGAITIEKEKETLDALLTTPMPRSQILFGKWLGNALAFRWSASLWLGAIWLFGLATGGLHVLGLIALLVVLAVYAAACSSIGLAASAMTRSSMRAHVTAMLIGLVLIVCPLLPAPLVLLSGDAWLQGQYFTFVGFALLPPVTIGAAAFSNTQVASGVYDYSNQISCAIIGLLIWATIAVFFYRAAANSFLGRRFEAAGPVKPLRAKEKVAVGTVEGGG